MPSTVGIISIGQGVDFFNGRYYREILASAGRELAAQSYALQMIGLTHQQAGTTAVAQAVLSQYPIDAALVLAPGDVFLASIHTVFPLIPGIILSSPNLDTSYSYVNSDNYGAMRDIVQHLITRGMRRIKLLLPSLPFTGDYRERKRGYEDAIAAAGFEPLIMHLPYPISDSVLTEHVLNDQPDALIAPSDNDALALMSRLQRRGIRIPDDILLVGFDDEEFASETFPTLTTVSQPLSEMARRATLYLLDRLAGINRDVYHAILPNRLIIRESSSRAS